jgi:N-acetyl-anhydromuramyl-L-alanine amidase AmpD
VRACFLNDEGDRFDSQGEWATLRANLRQFVIHYDATGTSERCFRALHDQRGLSSHFLIDLDGTIYQTLDVRERARHAGAVNDISVGVEIANPGAYGSPEALADAAIRMGGANTKGGRVYKGELQGRRLYQYGFTGAQYTSLIGLVRAVRQAAPNISLNAPTDTRGSILDWALPPGRRTTFSGIVGHYHVGPHKVDPGPAFDWERVLSGIRRSANSSRGENQRAGS